MVNHILALGMVFGLCLTAVAGGDGPNPNQCCLDCSCAYCGDIKTCLESPFYSVSDCDPGGAGVCGVGGTPCTTFWENNTLGVSGTDRGDGVPNDCIPIDGGLGFLIAGGLGIGVVGIRRRKEEPLLKRA